MISPADAGVAVTPVDRGQEAGSGDRGVGRGERRHLLVNKRQLFDRRDRSPVRFAGGKAAETKKGAIGQARRRPENDVPKRPKLTLKFVDPTGTRVA